MGECGKVSELLSERVVERDDERKEDESVMNEGVRE